MDIRRFIHYDEAGYLRDVVETQVDPMFTKAGKMAEPIASIMKDWKAGLSTGAMKVVTNLVAKSNLGQLKDAVEIELESYSDEIKQEAYLEVIEFVKGS